MERMPFVQWSIRCHCEQWCAHVNLVSLAMPTSDANKVNSILESFFELINSSVNANDCDLEYSEQQKFFKILNSIFSRFFSFFLFQIFCNFDSPCEYFAYVNSVHSQRHCIQHIYIVIVIDGFILRFHSIDHENHPFRTQIQKTIKFSRIFESINLPKYLYEICVFRTAKRCRLHEKR